MAKKATATKKAPPAKKSAKQPRATVMVCLTTTVAAVPTVKILGSSVWGSTLTVSPGTPVTVMGFASAGLMSSGLSAVLISVDDDTVTQPVSSQPAAVTGKKTRWQAS